MADKPAEEEEVLTNSEEEAKPSEAAPSQPPEEQPEEAQPSEAPEVTEEQEEQKPPSRRETLRIQQLLEKMKQQPKAPETTVPGGIDYVKDLEADPETAKVLEADRNSVVQEALRQNQAQLATYQWDTMVNVDGPQVAKDYPQLDKASTDFHPALFDSMTKMYFQLSGVQIGSDGSYTVTNPGMRWKDFVDSYFETADEIANEKTRTATSNLTKQASQTGIRPSGGRKGLDLTKAPNQMNKEELEARIAQDLGI